MRVAAVQAEPVWFDLRATTDKTVAIIGDAAARGIEFLAFPETWLPGYPWFLWMGETSERARLQEVFRGESVVLDGPEMDRIRAAASDHSVAVAVSFSERLGDNLFISLALIDRDGELAHIRRKLLLPGGREQEFFTSGSYEDLDVVAMSVGRVGGMVCSEHTRPSLRHELLKRREEIHVAAWPTFALMPAEPRLGSEVNMLLTRQYAADGGNFVLAPTMIVGATTRATMLSLGVAKDEVVVGGGASQIFDPLARPIGSVLDGAEEGVVLADIDVTTLRDIYDADPLGEENTR